MNDNNQFPQAEQFGEIKKLIEQSRHDALKSVNSVLIKLYWSIGAYISNQVSSAKWGDKTIDHLADYLTSHGAEYKGFNRRNLYRMKQFYEAYAGNEIVSPLVTQLGWSHHLLILSKTRTIDEREFYIKLVIKEKYSKRELERQLDSAIYERTMLSNKNTLVGTTCGKALQSVFKDSYALVFLKIIVKVIYRRGL
jgi:predicted nuclease of restriction endonuclease-like (RecB) superfamily